jgi:1,4-alpha-glucan branching enzyme
MTIAESTARPAVSRPTTSGLGFVCEHGLDARHTPLPELSNASAAAHQPDHVQHVLPGERKLRPPASHDEVVHGKRSLLWGMAGQREEQFANLRLWLAWQWIHAGKKLLFMGGEIAQDHEWAHDGSVEWHLLEHAPHRGVQSLVRDLNRLYQKLPALHEKDTEQGGFDWIDCQDREGSTLAVVRRGRDPNAIAIGVFNFSGLVREGYRIGAPLPGRYREVLNSDASAYGGGNVGNLGSAATESIGAHGYAQSLVLTLPALGALVLVPE